MADESQNALLKTLEEPPPFVHLLLLSAEPAALRRTVVSRCQRIPFQPLSPAAVEARLRDAGTEGTPAELRAAARLSGGKEERARFLISERGRDLRAAAERCARGSRARSLEDAPWGELLAIAERVGEEAGDAALELARERAELSGDERVGARARKEGEAAAKRVTRRRRTQTLDLALGLIVAWFRDLAAVGEGAGELVLHVDREAELRADAEGLDPRSARRAAELALETRRRLRVNVSEELALEALFFRVEALLANSHGSR
jgi:DNA polymerase-3 subunit delta'